MYNETAAPSPLTSLLQTKYTHKPCRGHSGGRHTCQLRVVVRLCVVMCSNLCVIKYACVVKFVVKYLVAVSVVEGALADSVAKLEVG